MAKPVSVAHWRCLTEIITKETGQKGGRGEGGGQQFHLWHLIGQAISDEGETDKMVASFYLWLNSSLTFTARCTTATAANWFL